MKKTIYTLAVTAIMTGTALASCESPAQKQEIAANNVSVANEELQQAKQQELNAEYPAFKKDAELKITANDKRIAELREKLSASGKSPLDDIRRQRIDDLQKRNAELRARLYGYEKERSDWLTFKAKFNQDADNLRDAFKDFGNDLKKKN
jgi:hypothetical protein